MPGRRRPVVGSVAEWSKALVLKTSGRQSRGFESYRFRGPRGMSLNCPNTGG